MFDDEMLTIEDLAAYLKLKPQTIYKWAQTGKIPGAKFGKEWRFRRSTIEKWIDSKISGPPAPMETSADASGAQGTRQSFSGQAPRSRDGGAVREGEVAQRDGASSEVSTGPGGRTAGTSARERFGGGIAPERGLAAKASPEGSALVSEGSAVTLSGLEDGAVISERASAERASRRSAADRLISGAPLRSSDPQNSMAGDAKAVGSGGVWTGPDSSAQSARAGDEAVAEEVAAHATERAYLQGGPALPVEKLTGARKGPRSGRKDRGPESN